VVEAADTSVAAAPAILVVVGPTLVEVVVDTAVAATRVAAAIRVAAATEAVATAIDKNIKPAGHKPAGFFVTRSQSDSSPSIAQFVEGEFSIDSCNVSSIADSRACRQHQLPRE
jgi:hypothetical protein